MRRRKSTAKAPGRLDFLGGVADYSGSLVLEMPLSLVTKVTVEEIPAPVLAFTSVHEPLFETSVEPDLTTVPKWVRYVYGCYAVFCKAHRWKAPAGLRFCVESNVPLSMGVSSSAALEVATMRSLELFSGKRFKGTALARAAQRAENEVVGAPCGLMDQLASAYGVQGQLLPIHCRPDQIGTPISLPKGVVAVGWPSGVKHAVSDSPYAVARAGAFMGKAMIEASLGRALRHVTELRPSEVRAMSREVLPETISGFEYVKRFGALSDPLSTIDLDTTYPVRAAVGFPVEENLRSETAVALLKGVTKSNRFSVLSLLGELLFQSHAGYSSIGLDCPETDLMVESIRALGPMKGFYGARVSGGGSGGTVVVLLEEGSLPALSRLASRLKLPSKPVAFLR